MNNIREEAKAVIDDSAVGMHGPVFVWEQTAVQYAKRVLLLEEAYRYQRAAYHLMLEVIQDEFDTSLESFHMAVKKMRDADDLYRQAEEL